jgi:hypothetical protein
MKHIIILALLLSFSTHTVVSAQSKTLQKEQFQNTYNSLKALVKAKEFKYVGEVVFSNAKRERLNSDSNTLTINNTNAVGSISALEKKAKATQIKGEISNYKVNFNDDLQTISIQFNVNKMTVYLNIKPNGNAVLTLKQGASEITQVGKLFN